MMLNFTSLTLFLFCSIGEAHARINAHMNGDFPFKIKNPTSGKCISINKDGDVIMDDFHIDFSSWDFKEAGTGGTTFTISNDGPSGLVCLIRNKDLVVSAKCDKSRDQNWIFMREDNVEDFRIKYKRDGTCMEVRTDSNGSNPKLTLEKCKNIKYQKFIVDFVIPPEGFTYRFIPISANKKCMQAKRDSSDDFVVVAGSCESGEAVGWQHHIETNQFIYQDPSSGNERCLDAKNGKNQVVTISKCNVDTISQKWLVNGYYDNTIESFEFNDFCMKLNMSTSKFNLRRCDDAKSDQLFNYEVTNRVSEIEAYIAKKI